ncbi:MAG: SGNH/GDSL hydrolase family protein [Actinomycetes bacterium]
MTSLRIRVAVLGFLAAVPMCGTALAAAAQTTVASPAQQAAGSNDKVWYLALGDSLSVGFQPNKGETDKGYVDNLSRRVREHVPSLALRNVGCAGETSRSLITGAHSPCRYVAGSQLDAALAFLKAHPGRIGFITVDIGANDLLRRCLDGHGVIDLACTTEQGPRMQARTERIVDALRSAAGPNVPILGMKYYNPFLGYWGNVPGGRSIARADQRAWVVFNEALTSAYESAGATVADVAATFRIDDFADTVMLPDGRVVPVNVALACEWTWFCSKFATDPHANNIGYRKIGRTFYDTLLALVSSHTMRLKQSPT